jgi:hypothetical protein
MCILPFFGTKAFRAEHWRLSVIEWLGQKPRV